MKKFFLVLTVLALGTASLPAVSHAQMASAGSQDTVLDKAGDWLATMGKSGQEKDQILMERRTKRATERFQKSMNQSAEKAGKSMQKMGKDMEKAFQS